MENLLKVTDVVLLLSDEPRFQKETLETWALSIINKCSHIANVNPLGAKDEILELFKQI